MYFLLFTIWRNNNINYLFYYFRFYTFQTDNNVVFLFYKNKLILAQFFQNYKKNFYLFMTKI